MLSMLALGTHFPAMMMLSAFNSEVGDGLGYALIVLIGWLQWSLLALARLKVGAYFSRNTAR